MGCCPGGTKHTSKVEPLEKADVVGLSKDRGCTDILCLFVIFPAFLFGMGYTAYLAWETGDPYAILHGRDSWGNICNKDNTPISNVSLSGRDMTGKGKSFYFNPAALVDQTGSIKSDLLCVERCPPQKLGSVSELQSFYHNTTVSYCRYDVAVADFSDGGKCPNLPIDEHYDLVNRCFPKTLISTTTGLAGQAASAIVDKIQPNCHKEGDFFNVAASDIEVVWKEILYLLAIAVGVAFILTLLMGVIATIIIWTLLIGTVLGCLAATAVCWWYWYSFDSIPDADKSDTDRRKTKEWLIIACVVSVVAAVFLLIILVLRKRIQLVAQLFREAAKAMRNMPCLLLQPLWTLIALLVVMAGTLYVFSYVITAGDPTVDSDTGHVEFKPNQVLFYMRWYYILGILWWIQFLYACEQMVLAAAVVIWYFRRDKSKLGWPILRAHGTLIRYHLGSVLFGSFLIALVQLARIILEYVEKTLKLKANKCSACLIKCLKCCLWCFEKVLKFINTNAYIMTAIHGHNFCRAAWAALAVIVANVLRVAMINSVGAFILFLGKCGVVAITVVIGFQFFIKDHEDICYQFAPLIVVGVLAYFVAHCFLTTYSMAIDTIFMCFCEDCSANDGVDRPYYMSRDLMEFVDNSSEALAADNARKRKPAAGAKEQLKLQDV